MSIENIVYVVYDWPWQVGGEIFKLSTELNAKMTINMPV